MFAVFKYLFRDYFVCRSRHSLRRPRVPTIARLAASTALPSHCRAIWASQIPQSAGSSYPRSACPYPHADETHPQHRSRSRFGFSGSRNAQSPNPTRRNKLRRREDHQKDCPRMQVPSSRRVSPSPGLAQPDFGSPSGPNLFDRKSLPPIPHLLSRGPEYPDWLSHLGIVQGCRPSIESTTTAAGAICDTDIAV